MFARQRSAGWRWLASVTFPGQLEEVAEDFEDDDVAEKGFEEEGYEDGYEEQDLQDNVCQQKLDGRCRKSSQQASVQLKPK